MGKSLSQSVKEPSQVLGQCVTMKPSRMKGALRQGDTRHVNGIKPDLNRKLLRGWGHQMYLLVQPALIILLSKTKVP